MPALRRGAQSATIARANLRHLITERGPDAGRQLDHLKLASLDGASEALLRAYETTGPAAAVTITGADGSPGFMIGRSRIGGSDTL